MAYYSTPQHYICAKLWIALVILARTPGEIPSVVKYKQSKIDKALLSAIKDNDKNKVHQLLDQGANSNALVKDKISASIRGQARPLELAVYANNIEIATDLLKYGANPNNKQNIGKNTPLHIAALKGYSDMIALLLAYKANPSIYNSQQKTALEVINTEQTPNYQEIYALLSSYVLED